MSHRIKPDTDNGPYLFISYSRKDNENVQNILGSLRTQNFRFWYDEGIKPGLEWAEELGMRIKACEQFLLLMSPNAATSKYVKKEVEMALTYDRKFSIVYLQPTTLPPGLELLLKGIHHIKFYDTERADFEEKLRSSIPVSVTKYKTPDFFMSSDVDSIDFTERYKVIRQLGAGGVSEVYLAEDTHTGAVVSIKSAKNAHSKHFANTFAHERDILNQLSECPFVPKVLDFVHTCDALFLVENYIKGKSLEDIETFSEKEIVEIGLKTLKIIEFIHSLHILHMDIKPRNLIIDRFGYVFLIDHNLSQVVDADGFVRPVGFTRGFASPQQRAVSGISYPSDIYSIGMTLKAVLLKQYLSVSEISELRCPIRVYRGDISPELEYVIEKMVQPNPSNRYQTAQEAYNNLKDYKAHSFMNKAALYLQSETNIRRFKTELAKKHQSDRDFVKDMLSMDTLPPNWKLPSLKTDRTTVELSER